MIIEPRRTSSAIIALAVSLCLATGAAAEEAWPQFRGPGGQGHAQAAGLPLKWSETENVAWKRSLPGRGWSSPVIYGDQVWMSTAIETEISAEERERRLQGVKQARQRDIAGAVTWRALCVAASGGEIIHDLELFHDDAPKPIHTLNSYASPTPILEAGRAYFHFGTYGTACVETATGKVLWQRQLRLAHYVGPGSSPALYENLLIIPCDGADVQYVTALNKYTGETFWKTDRPPIDNPDGDFRKAYCTPLVIRYDGQDQVVIPGAQWVVSYEPTTGKEIWRANYGRGFSNVPRPVYGDGVVYICTGFTKPQLWAIRVDGRDDVTETHVLWKSTRQIPAKPSPLLVDGLLYIISDQGVATCFDAASGKAHWTERVAGNYSASPLYVGAPGAPGRIYFCSHDGKTTVVAADSAFRELATSQLDGQLMASPAILPGAMFLRTDTHLYRIEDSDGAVSRPARKVGRNKRSAVPAGTSR